MKRLAAYLNRRMTGAVYASKRVTEAYSTDQSGLKLVPQMVAIPTSTRDLQKLVVFSGSLASKGVKLGLTPRGSATDKTGAAIGSGIAVSLREEMNKILELDVRQKLVRVQTGVTLRELNNVLALHGLTLPLAADEQTIGGLIANNFSGPMSAKYGGIGNYIINLEVVLSDGTVTSTAPVSRKKAEQIAAGSGLLSEIYRTVLETADPEPSRRERARKNEPAPRPEEPNFGYRSGVFDDGRQVSLLPLLLGSQGTLGIIAEAILRVVYFEELPTLVAARFDDFATATAWVEAARQLEPSLGDVYSLELLREAAAVGKALNFLQLDAGKVLVVLGFDELKQARRAKKAHQATRLLPEGVEYDISDENNYEDFLQLREIIGVYLNETGRARDAICDDVYIPVEASERFTRAVGRLGAELNLSLALYGSLLSGEWSVRPDLGGQKRLVFLKNYARLVKLCGGSITGGSPEGRTKAGVTAGLVDPTLIARNQTIKQTFDPAGILNPGVKVSLPTEKLASIGANNLPGRILP